MKKHTYGIFNIESSNYSLGEEDIIVYKADMQFTKSGLAYYTIETTWWQYLKFKFRFWWMRKTSWSKVHIRRLH